MSLVDTSALVALLDAGHPHHADAARDLAEGHITVTWGTLAETALVVRRLAKDSGQDGNRAARDALAAVTALAGFRQAATTGLDKVLQLHGKEPALSFVDAWNLWSSLESNEPLVSYDRDLRAAHRKHGK